MLFKSMAAALVCVGAACCGRRIGVAVDKQQSRQARWGGRRKASAWCCNAAAAASNSDSRPDLWKSGSGYHPLEELSSAEKEEAEKLHAGKLSHGEIARTIAEVNSNAILLAPALSQSNSVYGTEVMYLVDEHGDIYFELADDNDVLHKLSMDPRCSLIIGFGELNELLTTELLPTYENHLVSFEEEEEDEAHRLLVEDAEDDVEDGDEAENDEGEDGEEASAASSSSLPNDAHPMVFASKLAKVAAFDAVSKIFKPSMRLAMTGVVRSVSDEEEPYARRIWEDRFLWEKEEEEDEDDDETSGDEEQNNQAECSHDAAAAASEESSSDDDSEDDWTDDGEQETSLYKFEIHSIQLASDIGAHAAVEAKDFRYSEADVLADAAADIMKRLNSPGKKKALKNLCFREKNTEFEEVAVIGVDSLGMDVRASRGIELRTMRFPFARRARCVDTAQTLLHQLLYPRNRHKK